MDKDRTGGPPEVVLDEADILAAQPGREEALDRQPGGPELVGSKYEAESKNNIS